VRKTTTLVYCDRSDIGRRRTSNQDAKAVLPAESPPQYRSRGWLFLVADGMGAHAAGELASSMAAEGVPKTYEEYSEFSPPLALRRSLERVNAAINKKGTRNANCHGMGTTCTALVLHPRGVLLGHVGDSRAYRVRGRVIEQLSRDHSLVWELESAGGMSREQAADAAPKNIITRSMGPHSQLDIDLEGPFPVEADDVFVLCSDGLSGIVGDEEIGLLAAELQPQEAVAALIGLALIRGAPDNVTVIAARAGQDEVSRKSRNDAPWPLSEEATSSQRQGYQAWVALAVAAVGLLVALIANPWSTLVANRAPATQAICTALSLAGGLAAVGGGIFGMVSILTTGARGRLLHPGDVLGKGPYRRYDCTPSQPLVEGLVASLEGSTEAISADDRARTVPMLTRARQHAAAGAFHEAVTAVAEAIAVHMAAIEGSRRDETTRSERPPEPSSD